MEFQYHGGNCISIQTKESRIVIDDTLAGLGLKPVTKPDDIVFFSTQTEKTPSARLVISDPGEYEISGVSVFGIAARAHMDEPGKESAIIYKFQYGDLRVASVGHIHPDISEDELEELGAVDVLIVPVGGNGYTLDGIGALSIIKKIEPKVVIPTHYEDSKVSYPVPQQPLTEALKGLAMEPKETVAKFKPKPADLNETLQLIVLTRS